MRPFKELISVADALSIAVESAVPIDRTERVRLDAADGRVAAQTVTASTDVPPFDRAAMDGYAVVAEDTIGAERAAPRPLRLVERVYTGQVPTRAVARGECIEIATGAPMPHGADAVVMVEETEIGADETIRILTTVNPGQHVGRRGADVLKGQPVVERGTLINPSRVGAIAATGVLDVSVYARPHVAILSTGNELVDPGEPLAPGRLYDINRFTLAAVIGRHGGVAVPHPLVPDTLPALTAALDAALADDIVVFSGGSSVGERDFLLDLLRSQGEVLFHGIAVKPGKPTAFGRVRGKLVFGMPGYPTSCLSNAYMLLVPTLRRTARLPAFTPRTTKARLARRIASVPGRHQFYTVRLEGDVAHPAFKASGDITSMSQADGYIEIPAQADVVEAGEIVEVKLF
jgi:molybdenum cofactor synthesis domain-containing protein